jgi:hypothetical protein
MLRIVRETIQVGGSLDYQKKLYDDVLKKGEAALNKVGGTVQSVFIDRADNEINFVAVVSIPDSKSNKEK